MKPQGPSAPFEAYVAERLEGAMRRLAGKAALDGQIYYTHVWPRHRALLLALAAVCTFVLCLPAYLVPVPLGGDGNLIYLPLWILFGVQVGLFALLAWLFLATRVGIWLTPSRLVRRTLARSAELQFGRDMRKAERPPLARYLVLVWQVERAEVMVLVSPAALQALSTPLWRELMRAFGEEWQHASPPEAFQALVQGLIPLASLYFEPDEADVRQGFWAFAPLEL